MPPLRMMFLMIYSGGSIVQLGVALLVIKSFGNMLFFKMFCYTGFTVTPFLLAYALCRPMDPYAITCSLLLIGFYIRLLRKFGPPRNRKKIRKLLGEKGRVARQKLISSIPTIRRPQPAGA